MNGVTIYAKLRKINLLVWRSIGFKLKVLHGPAGRRRQRAEDIEVEHEFFQIINVTPGSTRVRGLGVNRQIWHNEHEVHIREFAVGTPDSISEDPVASLVGIRVRFTVRVNAETVFREAMDLGQTT